MHRETAQLFDMMFKYILHEASKPAVVHFINGLFDKRYPSNSEVVFLKTESVNKKNRKLEKIISDIPLTINGDSFLIETQIDDNLEMALRVFQYAFATAKGNKSVSADGSVIKLKFPEPRVIYFESSGRTPDFLTLQIEYPKGKFEYKIPAFKVLEKPISFFDSKKLTLLLPFYLLKFRKELQKKSTNSAKRKEIAKEENTLVVEIDRILEKHEKENLVSSADILLLIKEVQRMHGELYGNYKELSEVDMTIMEKVKTHHKEWCRRKIRKTVALIKKGYTPDEIEKIVLKEYM